MASQRTNHPNQFGSLLHWGQQVWVQDASPELGQSQTFWKKSSLRAALWRRIRFWRMKTWTACKCSLEGQKYCELYQKNSSSRLFFHFLNEFSQMHHQLGYWAQCCSSVVLEFTVSGISNLLFLPKESIQAGLSPATTKIFPLNQMYFNSPSFCWFHKW